MAEGGESKGQRGRVENESKRFRKGGEGDGEVKVEEWWRVNVLKEPVVRTGGVRSEGEEWILSKEDDEECGGVVGKVEEGKEVEGTVGWVIRVTGKRGVVVTESWASGLVWGEGRGRWMSSGRRGESGDEGAGFVCSWRVVGRVEEGWEVGGWGLAMGDNGTEKLSEGVGGGRLGDRGVRRIRVVKADETVEECRGDGVKNVKGGFRGYRMEGGWEEEICQRERSSGRKQGVLEKWDELCVRHWAGSRVEGGYRWNRVRKGRGVGEEGTEREGLIGVLVDEFVGNERAENVWIRGEQVRDSRGVGEVEGCGKGDMLKRVWAWRGERGGRLGWRQREKVVRGGREVVGLGMEGYWVGEEEWGVRGRGRGASAKCWWMGGVRDRGWRKEGWRRGRKEERSRLEFREGEVRGSIGKRARRIVRKGGGRKLEKVGRVDWELGGKSGGELGTMGVQMADREREDEGGGHTLFWAGGGGKRCEGRGSSVGDARGKKLGEVSGKDGVGVGVEGSKIIVSEARSEGGELDCEKVRGEYRRGEGVTGGVRSKRTRCRTRRVREVEVEVSEVKGGKRKCGVNDEGGGSSGDSEDVTGDWGGGSGERSGRRGRIDVLNERWMEGNVGRSRRKQKVWEGVEVEGGENGEAGGYGGEECGWGGGEQERRERREQRSVGERKRDKCRGGVRSEEEVCEGGNGECGV
ncbi:hypothetical protein Tco_0568814 [Tanacetum coccineum]